MTPIRRSEAGIPHIHSETPAAKKPSIDRSRDAVVDQLERNRPGNRLDPSEMRRHIDLVLEGPFGPIGGTTMYGISAGPRPDKPIVPPGGVDFPGGWTTLYGIDTQPHPGRPRPGDWNWPPDVRALYAVDIDPDPVKPRPGDGNWPPDVRALYAVDIDPPTPIHEPPIRAMYGISIDDIQPWPRKA
jgi:hypothetical protein